MVWEYFVILHRKSILWDILLSATLATYESQMYVGSIKFKKVALWDGHMRYFLLSPCIRLDKSLHLHGSKANLKKIKKKKKFKLL